MAVLLSFSNLALVNFVSVRCAWASSLATWRRSCRVRGSTLPQLLLLLPEVVTVRRLPKLAWLSSFQLPFCLPASDAARMRSRMSDVGNGVIVCWPDDESERFLIATTIVIAGLFVSSATSKCDESISCPHKMKNLKGKPPMRVRKDTSA